MPRLSIIIPVLKSIEALERTLVSVLEKRPADCEIIVVLNTSYDDPYQLTDEVRFIAAPTGARWAECVALGLSASRAPIVNLLAAGIEVSDDWTGPAVAHFRDPQVWAVSPAAHGRVAPEKLLDSGVDESGSGVSGPRWWSGFYRQAMLEGSLGVFDSALDPSAAAADLAWRQSLAGRRSMAEAQAVVYVPPDWVQEDLSFRAGYQTERLFWRRRAGSEHRPSLVGHVLQLAAAGIVPQRWLHLAGSLTAWLSIGQFRREGKLAAEAAIAARATKPPAQRIKSPHMLKSNSASART